MSAYEKLNLRRLTWQQFEDLCAELLKAEGFMNVKKLGRGATGGDLVANELSPPSPSGRQEIVRWLVQCKHYAVSGKSVPLKELGVMTSVLKRHRAQGLFLMTSTEPSGETSQALEDFDQDESHQYKAIWWDRLELCTRLVRHPELIGRFFGSMAAAWAREDQEAVKWEMLRWKYLEALRERYRMLGLRGLAPQLVEGPPGLLLAEIYVELPLEEGIVSLWDAVARGRIAILGESGAGKTTTVRYLALTLAGEPGTIVDQRFTHRLPIVAHLAKYARRTESEPGLRLVEHLCDQFKFGPLLKRELNAGRSLVLLDGLDEVSNPSAIVEQIEKFTEEYGANCIVITSREHAYRRARTGMRFQPLTIKPMEDFELVCQFIDQWYAARSVDLMSTRNGEEQPGAKELKEALRAQPQLKELAKNPLMLTIIIMMHWRGTALPARQIEVYQYAMDTLIRHWPLAKGRAEKDVLPLQQTKLLLAPIAYRILKGNGLIGEDELLKRLTEGIIRVQRWDENRAREMSVRWLDLICTQSGLLAAQGVDKQGKQVFGFSHQRFAEYLAARYLTDRWDKGEQHFVLGHVHRSRWSEVVVLFAAQAGLDRWILGTKVLEAIVNLNSPWEEVVWRDHLVAGRCLGEEVPVEGELLKEILAKLAHLLTKPQWGLRARALGVFANLSGTQYQEAALKHVRDLAEGEWPWDTKVAIAEALLKLGDREQSHELLIGLRNCAKRRGYRSDMSWVIELLLEGWKEETVEWLIGVAREYEGRGLRLGIGADPTETVVVAADESFSQVRIGKHLDKVELRNFVDRLMRVLTPQEQQERARWVWCQLNEASADEIHELATGGHDERVRRLSAEWLAEHGEREPGVQVLTELATHGDGNLLAAEALMRLDEHGSAIDGARTTLARTLYVHDEQEAATLLAELGEEIEAAVVSVELLLSPPPQKLNDRQACRVAEGLLSTPAREVGLTALKAMAASVQHTYRYEAAVALGEADEADEAYQTLLDIAERWGALDRVNAVLTLNDSPYAARLSQDQRYPHKLATLVVNGVSDKYDAVTKFLEAGIIPEMSGEAETVLEQGPQATREKWEERAQRMQATFRRVAEEWLDTLEQDQAPSYAQAARAYLLTAKEQTDDAVNALCRVAIHPEASARLLLRVGTRLLKLEARDAGLEALSKVPTQSADEASGWLQVALVMNAMNETDPVLDATRKVATAATEFQTRREAALLLNRLGQADEGKELLFRGIEAEVPGRYDWLLGSHVPEFREMLINLVEHVITLNPEFVRAIVRKAETLRQLGQYKEALVAVEEAIEVDDRYVWAWGVKGQTLQNMDQREKVIVALNRATELSPRYEWAWAFKAETHREIGQYDDALVSVEQALGINERNVETWEVKAQTLENMGQWEESLAAFERAIELYPNYSWAWALKAETLRRLGRYDEALEAVEQALKVDGSYSLAWRVKSETLDGMGRYDEALAMLVEALDSKDSAVRLSAIKAVAEIGDARAVAPLLTVAKDSETESAVRTGAAEALATLGDSRATEGLIQALEDPDSGVRAMVASALGDLEDTRATDALLAALEDRDNAVRGAAAMALGKSADERIFERLSTVVLDEEKEVAEQAAWGLVMTDSERALDVLQQAATARPEIAATLYRGRGVLLRRLGRLDEAIDAHNEVIQSEQHQAVQYLSRGLTYHVREEYDLATADLRRVIALHPSWGGPWDSLGCALFEMDQDDEAMRAWWRAKSAANGDACVLADLGIGLWATGKRKESLRLWRRAVTREPKLGRDRQYMWREMVWGPKMVRVAQEIVAAVGASEGEATPSR